MIGDFNGTVNVQIDRSSTKKKCNEGKLPNSFFDLVKQNVLEDIWRKMNKKTKEYTFFFSSRHTSFSRLYMIWTTKEIDLFTKKAEILPKVSSDHRIMW